MDMKFISGVPVGASAALRAIAIVQGHFAVAALFAVGIASGSTVLVSRSVIPPLLTRGGSRDYAAAASRCFGVKPPRPMLGLS
jgi:Na+-driven multidrug efflux pump